MSRVPIEKVDEEKIGTASVFEEISALSERIRQRAFEVFEERRGGGRGGDGCAMDDWLSAERALIRIPEAELVEQEDRFEVRVSAPGFEPGEIQVTALPDALIVKAAALHTHDKTKGNVRFCEFGEKTLLRRFDLPEPIDLEKVTANLDKGVLVLTALKAKPEPSAKQKGTAA
jgi:HSP20 family protein